MVRDVGKKKRLVLFISVLFFSGHALSTDFTPGMLALSGELIAAACDIDPDSRELWVEFGSISARDINMNQEGKLIRPFQVRLIGCQFFDSNNQQSLDGFATVTFTGNTSVKDSTVLIPSGEGKGFGIQIRAHHGDVLNFGEPSSGYILNNEKNTLRFTASLVPIQ